MDRILKKNNTNRNIFDNSKKSVAQNTNSSVEEFIHQKYPRMQFKIHQIIAKIHNKCIKKNKCCVLKCTTKCSVKSYKTMICFFFEMNFRPEINYTSVTKLIEQYHNNYIPTVSIFK